MSEDLVSTRYMVDVDETAIAFYSTHPGFQTYSGAAPAFADVVGGDPRLLLRRPASSAGRPMPAVAGLAPAAGTGSTSSSRTSERGWSAACGWRPVPKRYSDPALGGATRQMKDFRERLAARLEAELTGGARAGNP